MTHAEREQKLAEEFRRAAADPDFMADIVETESDQEAMDPDWGCEALEVFPALE